MKEKKAYLILAIGWEYNDEYYSTGNYGETFEKPEEIFLDKDKAKTEWIKREIESFRGCSLVSYMGEQDIEDYLTNVSIEEFFKYFKDNFGIELNEDDWYELEIPNSATDKQIKEIIDMVSIRFNKLHEIKITE